MDGPSHEPRQPVDSLTPVALRWNADLLAPWSPNRRNRVPRLTSDSDTAMIAIPPQPLTKQDAVRSRYLPVIILVGTMISSFAGFTASAPGTHGSDGASVLSTSRHPIPRTRMARPAATFAGATTITFSEFPVGTIIDNQYRNKGIVFEGDVPNDAQYIVDDGANPSSPVLSGTPTFTGDVGAHFVLPGTIKPTSATRLELDVGYIDNPGSTELIAYNPSGDVVGTAIAEQRGIDHLSLSGSNMARFVVKSVGAEDAGFAVDNVSFELNSFTVHGSIPIADVTGDPTSDQAHGSASLVKQCLSIGGQIKYAAYENVGTAIANHMIGAPDGSFLLRHFLSGTGSAVNFPDSSAPGSVSFRVAGNEVFSNLKQAVEKEMTFLLNSGETKVALTNSLSKPNFTLGFHQRDLDLSETFGGTQGLDVNGKGHLVGGRYIGTLTFILRDSYGFALNDKFLGIGAQMHYLQTVCGAPEFQRGAHWFPDSVTVTVPFDLPSSKIIS